MVSVVRRPSVRAYRVVAPIGRKHVAAPSGRVKPNSQQSLSDIAGTRKVSRAPRRRTSRAKRLLVTVLSGSRLSRLLRHMGRSPAAFSGIGGVHAQATSSTAQV